MRGSAGRVGGQLELYAEAPLPTERGTFRAVVFRERPGRRRDGARRRSGSATAPPVEHVALVMGDVRGDGVLARVHSECLTSEVLGSLKCDCRAQLDGALDLIARRGRGVLVYLRQEGRGIGLGNKIRAYALQARGHDTYQANRMLGFEDDLRCYDAAAEILRLLGVRGVELVTNNPHKLAALAGAGIAVHRRVALPSPANAHNIGYLETKRTRTGHLIEILEGAPRAKAS